jgi:hypothetical protein
MSSRRKRKGARPMAGMVTARANTFSIIFKKLFKHVGA